MPHDCNDILGYEMSTQCTSLRGESELHRSAGRLPDSTPNKALGAMHRRRACENAHGVESSGSAQLTKAAGSERRLMRKISMSEVTPERAHRVRHSHDENPRRAQRRMYSIQGLKHLWLGQVFEEVRGGNDIQLGAIEPGAEVTEFDLAYAGSLSEFDLLRADIDAPRIRIAVEDQLLDQLPLATTKIHHRGVPVVGEVGQDVQPESHSVSHFVRHTSVGRRVSVIQSRPNFVSHLSPLVRTVVVSQRLR